jgi:exopolysaccharide biosynthesis protein
LFTALLSLSGCDVNEDPNSWHIVDDSFAYKEWNFEKDKTGGSFSVYLIRPEKFKIHFLNSSDEPQYVSDWLYDNDAAEIVINGAYFHEDFTPSGYLKINSERIGERLFDQNLSGLVQMEGGKFSIRDLSVTPLSEGEQIENGMQSYPYLIKNSKPAVTEDTEKTARRTAIGLDNEGNIYIIISDISHTSLFEFMNNLINTGIPFTDVLNLDGGTSTGIAVSYGSFREVKDSLVKVPSVIVFDKI